MKKIRVFLLILVFSFMFITTANAVEYSSATNKFMFDDHVISKGSVSGDIVAIGGSVKLDNGAAGDVIAAGRDVIIMDEGSVQNIFAAGQYVTIQVKDAKSIYAAGSVVDVSADSGISAAYLAGESVSFSGNAIDVYATGGSVFVDGMISGNLKIQSDNITFGDHLSVFGSIHIYATVMPELPSSIDEAQVTFHLVEYKDVEGAEPLSTVIGKILSILTAIGFAVLLTLIRGGFFKARADEFKNRAGWTILYGFISFIVIPLGSVLLMFTVIGIPLSIIALMLFGIILYLAPVLTGIVLGRFLLKNMNRYLSAMIGAAVVKLLLLIPYLNTALFFACAFFALGIIMTALKPVREPSVKSNPPVIPPDSDSTPKLL